MKTIENQNHNNANISHIAWQRPLSCPKGINASCWKKYSFSMSSHGGISISATSCHDSLSPWLPSGTRSSCNNGSETQKPWPKMVSFGWLQNKARSRSADSRQDNSILILHTLRSQHGISAWRSASLLTCPIFSKTIVLSYLKGGKNCPVRRWMQQGRGEVQKKDSHSLSSRCTKRSCSPIPSVDGQTEGSWEDVTLPKSHHQ